ncbi:MAG: flagellar protein FlaG [Porticoccus sp.]|nr:flagellar protein FlaG [Porticoccus sp.]
MSDSAIISDALTLVGKPASLPTGNSSVSAVERQEVSLSGNQSPQSSAPREAAVSLEEVTEAVSNITDYVQSISRDLQFKIDEHVGSTVVTVLDHETQEVIRQIPSEEVVAMARHIAEQAPDPVKGLLMNGEG